MENTGWVSLHRKAWNNFLYKENRPLTRREAWEDIIAFVNYEDGSVLLGNEKIECKRGQSVRSLESWGKQFRWNKSKVKRYFALLASETMIRLENVRKSTRITVCNYDYYQRDRNTNETQMKRDCTTNNNNNNENNENKSVSVCVAQTKIKNEKIPFVEVEVIDSKSLNDIKSKEEKPRGAAVRAKLHLFDESEIAGIEAFKSKITDDIFIGVNHEFYYHKISNWAKNAKNNKRKDWVAFVKNWIMKDIAEKKAIMMPISNQKYITGYE